MALSVLDGNQTATTLSSVVTGGEHIVAHSVVSLGANAIANITSAVSGSVVSVSNFPASQSTTFGAITGSVSVLNFPSTQTIAGTVTIGAFPTSSQYIEAKIINDDTDTFYSSVNPFPISGTVTANVTETLIEPFDSGSGAVKAIAVHIKDADGNNWGAENIFPVVASGTVTVGNSVTIGAMPNGALTTRFGTPTTASVAFATSCVTNSSRKYLLIQNVTTGSNVITVGIGFTPTTTQGIQLTAGAGITFESSYIPTGAVYVLSSVTSSNFTILEA
jgi:hypothetical protein